MRIHCAALTPEFAADLSVAVVILKYLTFAPTHRIPPRNPAWPFPCRARRLETRCSRPWLAEVHPTAGPTPSPAAYLFASCSHRTKPLRAAAERTARGIESSAKPPR